MFKTFTLPSFEELVALCSECLQEGVYVQDIHYTAQGHKACLGLNPIGNILLSL